MGFYDLDKQDRVALIGQISSNIAADLHSGKDRMLRQYFADDDTYIRKSAYLAIGKLYSAHGLPRTSIISALNALLSADDPKIRQTAVNAAGEIGKTDFNPNFALGSGCKT